MPWLPGLTLTDQHKLVQIKFIGLHELNRDLESKGAQIISCLTDV